MTLDACRRDFSALIHRIEMEKELETCPEQRLAGLKLLYYYNILCVCVCRPPGGVTWEVRKTSPSKATNDKRLMRRIDMSELTWADRVRGNTSQPETNAKEEDNVCSDKHEDSTYYYDDDDVIGVDNNEV